MISKNPNITPESTAQAAVDSDPKTNTKSTNEPMCHFVLKSIVYRLPRFTKGILSWFSRKTVAPDDHQLVWHVIGTLEQCREVEGKFMSHCELFVDGLNYKECKEKDEEGNAIKPKYECRGFVSYITDASLYGAEVIELPNCCPA